MWKSRQQQPDRADEDPSTERDSGKSVGPPVWEFDLDRDGKKDLIIVEENGKAKLYISLRYVLAIAVGVLLTVTGYLFDVLPGV